MYRHPLTEQRMNGTARRTSSTTTDAFPLVERLIAQGRIYVCNGRRAEAVADMCREGEVAIEITSARDGGWWIVLADADESETTCPCGEPLKARDGATRCF